MLMELSRSSGWPVLLACYHDVSLLLQCDKPLYILHVVCQLLQCYCDHVPRVFAGPMMIGCSEGGTSIEDLAEKFPDKIVKIPVDVRKGLTDAQVMIRCSLPHKLQD